MDMIGRDLHFETSHRVSRLGAHVKTPFHRHTVPSLGMTSKCSSFVIFDATLEPITAKLGVEITVKLVQLHLPRRTALFVWIGRAMGVTVGPGGRMQRLGHLIIALD